MVTSAMKEALFVQSGGLVGKGVPTVGVSDPANKVADVAVAETSGACIVGVSDMTGGSVMEIRAVAT